MKIRRLFSAPSIRLGVLLCLIAQPSITFAASNPADGPWSGSVQAVLDVQTGTYMRKETQTWTLTGEAPTLNGAFRIYNATWTVTGQGSLKRAQGAQLITTTWAVNVPATPVQLAVFVRASDNRLIFRQWSSPKQVPGAITGTRQMTVNGQPGPTTPLTAGGSEWSFLWIDAAQDETTVSGSRTINAENLPADFHFSGIPVTATCTWRFTKGGGSDPTAQGSPREPVPQLLSIAPAAVDQGANNVLVTLKSQGTHWQTGATTADFGPDVQVAALAVVTPTEVVARIHVSSSAPIGPRKVSLTTPTTSGKSEVVSIDKFTVNAVLTAVTVPGLITIPSLGTKPPVLPPPPPIGTAPKSGSYRIVLNGFRVHSRTFEGVENDGPGDEVYAGVKVSVGGRTGGGQVVIPGVFLRSQAEVKTAVHGNIQNRPGRVRAGSAHEFGGLRNGDVLPTGQDPARTTANPIPRTFPLLVWEGQLTDGEEVLVIEPSLWEADGDDCNYSDWSNASLPSFHKERLRERLDQRDCSPIDAGPSGSLLCFNSYFDWMSQLVGVNRCSCQPGKDRPIGLKDGNEQSARYHHLAIVVTREAIEKMLASPPRADGLPPGVLSVPLVDEGLNFSGNYELFLRFERMAGAPATPPPGALPTIDVAPPPPSQRTVAPEPTTAVVTPTRPTERTLAPEPPPPQIMAVPNQAPQWTEDLTITFTAPQGNFVPGTTTVDLGPGITAAGNQYIVESPTRVSGVFRIAGDAPPGPHTVTIRTGSQVLSQPYGFVVVARAAQDVFRITPASAARGQQNVEVLIDTSPWRYFSGSATTDFGAGIALRSLQVLSATSARATFDIAADAPLGPRTVTVRRALRPPDAFPNVFTVTAPLAMSQMGGVGGKILNSDPPPSSAGAAGDPELFTARQSGPSDVQLTWNAVPGVAAYLVSGPAAEQGVKFAGTSAIVSGLAPGTYKWSIASWYEPGGARTPVEGRRSASITVTRTRDDYRVTAVSVVFHRDESDNPGMSGDGRSNEIYLTSFAQVIDRRDGRQLAAGPLKRSPVHGDITGNPSGGVRVLAGSYTANGGIRTNDVVSLRMPAGSGSGYTPCWIWSGELRDGIDVLILRPVVWEFDGVEGPWFQPYVQRLTQEPAGDVFRIPAVAGVINQPNLFAGVVPQLKQSGPWTPDREDHPIGCVLASTGGIVAGSDPDLTWFDRVIVVTREKIELLLQGGTSASMEMRLPGDGRDWIADCTLKLTFERGTAPSSSSSSSNTALIQDALKKLQPKIAPGS